MTCLDCYPSRLFAAAWFSASCRCLTVLLLTALIVLLTPTPARAQPHGGQPQMHLPRVQLRTGLFRIDAQVASRFQDRQTGLMHRRDMPDHEGMLFVFETPAVQCFWMKNTPLPLTAAFLDERGTIVNLADMQPLSEQSHCSARPVRFVLEMNQGWFARRGLGAGDRIAGTPFLP